MSEPVRAKISDRHNIDPSDVRRAIVAVEGLRYKHRSDPPRGSRYYVEFWVGDDRALAVLYPVMHPLGDVYALGSAYREPKGLDAAAGSEPPLVGRVSGVEGNIAEHPNVNEDEGQMP